MNNTAKRYLILLFTSCSLVACALNSSVDRKPIPERSDRSSGNQFAKSDFDRMADVEISENMQSLRNLMIKLYKRNPHELAKSTADNAEKMATWVIDGQQQHHSLFKEIDNKQGIEAIFLSFKPEYTGYRV